MKYYAFYCLFGNKHGFKGYYFNKSSNFQLAYTKTLKDLCLDNQKFTIYIRNIFLLSHLKFILEITTYSNFKEKSSKIPTEVNTEHKKFKCFTYKIPSWWWKNSIYSYSYNNDSCACATANGPRKTQETPPSTMLIVWSVFPKSS